MRKGKKAVVWLELSRRIQALPQELQDHILDFALLIKPGIVNIDVDYKPPWQLRVSQKTRNNAARHYYSTSSFKLSDDFSSRRSLSRNWLKSLATEHQEMLGDVRVSGKGAEGWPTMQEIQDTRAQETKLYLASEKARIFTMVLQLRRIEIKKGVVKFNYFMVLKTGRRGAVRISEHWASEYGPM